MICYSLERWSATVCKLISSLHADVFTFLDWESFFVFCVCGFFTFLSKTVCSVTTHNDILPCAERDKYRGSCCLTANASVLKTLSSGTVKKLGRHETKMFHYQHGFIWLKYLKKIFYAVPTFGPEMGFPKWTVLPSTHSALEKPNGWKEWCLPPE